MTGVAILDRSQTWKYKIVGILIEEMGGCRLDEPTLKRVLVRDEVPTA